MWSLLTIVALAVAVFIHEFGHFFIGKAMGVRVLEVQVFFIPLITWQPDVDANTPADSWRRTKWILGLLPLGGVTHFYDAGTYSSRSLSAKAPWQRLLISLGGIVFNLATALLVFVMWITGMWMNEFVFNIGYVSFLLAVFNIIPVYPLDGGQALFIIYEMVTGRAPSDEFRRIAGIVGSIFIILVFWILPLF